MPFWSHFTEEETETQRKEVACQGHAVGFVAEPGFERNVSHPSRRTLWRADLHGLATPTWWPCLPSHGSRAASNPGAALPPGHFRGSSAGTESFLVLRGHSCRPPRTPPPAPEELVSVPGEGPHVTARFGVVRSGGPGRGSQPGPGGLWAPGAGAWGSSGKDRQESPVEGATSEAPELWLRALLLGVASAAEALGLLLSTLALAGISAQAGWQCLMEWESNPLTPTGAPDSTQQSKQHC